MDTSFLKVYGKESTNAILCKCSDRTFRKFTWKVLFALSDLESDSDLVSSYILSRWILNPNINFFGYLISLDYMGSEETWRYTRGLPCVN